MNFHEDYTLNTKLKLESERKFGITLACVFLILSLTPLIKGHSVRWWVLALSILFFVMAVLFPKILLPVNYAWARLGEFLRKITTPIILFILFFIIITPIALILRIFKKDLLNLHFSKSDSYWINGNKTEMSLKNQF